jgi:hypothetical protein
VAPFLASSYPLLDAFWTILEIVAFIIWIWLLFMVFADIFRSHDLSGFAKALWIAVVIFLPLFGVLLYLIVRGGSMHERQVRAAQAQQDAFRDYVRQTAGTDSGGSADQLQKLASLRQQGVISEDEFQREKAKILS